MSFHQLVKLVGKNLFKQIVDIAVIIIKCVAVDITGFNDILYRDFVKRLLAQKFNECVKNKLFCIFLRRARKKIGISGFLSGIFRRSDADRFIPGQAVILPEQDGAQFVADQGGFEKEQAEGYAAAAGIPFLCHVGGIGLNCRYRRVITASAPAEFLKGLAFGILRNSRSQSFLRPENSSTHCRGESLRSRSIYTGSGICLHGPRGYFR